MRCCGGGFAGAAGRTTGAFVGAVGTCRFDEALLPLRGGLRDGVLDGTLKRAANLADNGTGCGCGAGALIYSYLIDLVYYTLLGCIVLAVYTFTYFHF